ncbi:hypothetical protein V1511DRAFT_504816 [Dipodascopsis uninucleata]
MDHNGKIISEPIRISYIDGEYLVFNISHVKLLRESYNISGILVGTLPQVPQQSVFLGLPVQLLPEEAALLAEKGVVRIVNDEISHSRLIQNEFESSDNKDIEEMILANDSGIHEPRAHFSFYATDAVTEESLLIPADITEEVRSISKSPRFQIYKFLHSKGYFLSPGLRFGAQFLAYPGDPLRYHSHFLVRGLEWEEEFPLLDVIGSGRLGTGVKKAWMVGGIAPSSQNNLEINKESLHDEAIPDEEFVGYCIEWAGFG